MELQRVNPGVAGSIGVPVRVGRSNAGEVADVAARAGAAKAQGDAAISGALNRIAGAVENYSQMRAGHDIRLAQVEQKRVEADYKADYQLTATRYGTALDGISQQMRRYFDLTDEEFLQAVSREADNKLTDVVQASVAAPNEAGANGIGFRNGRAFEGRIKSELSAGLKAKFVNDQVVARAKYQKERAIGKGAENLNAMAEGGETDKKAYASTVEEQLRMYLTKEERAVLVEQYHNKGISVAWTAEMANESLKAQDTFNFVVDANLSSGKSINESATLALKEAETQLLSFIETNGEEFGLTKEERDEVFENARLKLAMGAQAWAKDVNKNAASNLREVVVSGGDVAPMNMNMPLLNVLYGAKADIPVTDDDKKKFADAVSVYGDDGEYGLANTMRMDIALLDINDEGDRALMLEYLTYARQYFPESVYADIQKFAQDKISTSGNEKPDKGAITEAVCAKFRVNKLSELSGDDAETALECVRVCGGMPPSQWGNLISSHIREKNYAKANKDSQKAVAATLSSSLWDKRTTLIILRKRYGYNVPAMTTEERLNVAEAAGN